MGQKTFLIKLLGKRRILLALDGKAKFFKIFFLFFSFGQDTKVIHTHFRKFEKYKKHKRGKLKQSVSLPLRDKQYSHGGVLPSTLLPFFKKKRKRQVGFCFFFLPNSQGVLFCITVGETIHTQLSPRASLYKILLSLILPDTCSSRVYRSFFISRKSVPLHL